MPKFPLRNVRTTIWEVISEKYPEPTQGLGVFNSQSMKLEAPCVTRGLFSRDTRIAMPWP